MRKDATKCLLALAGCLAWTHAPADDLLEIYGDLDQSGAALFGGEERPVARQPDYGTVVPSATLHITLKGVRNDQGRIHVLAYNDNDAYSHGAAEMADGYAETAALQGRIEIALDVHGEGPWAIFAFHDENGDKRLDMRGPRPQEGYVYSGAVEPGFPPTFDRAARVTDAVTLRMWYLSTRMRH